MSKIHLSVMLVICLVAGVVFYSRWNPRNREAGESRHYVTSTVSLLNAGRISFTKQDIQTTEDVFGKLLAYNFPRYAPSDRSKLHRLATVDAKSPDFRGRSYYWGTYSFLCIPIYWFCRAFHIFDSNMFNAFKWANILMLLVPLFALAFLLKGSVRLKYLMMAAFAFPSAAQYINWASAECCIYMLVVLSLIFLHNREYCRSSLCLSFAATLNYCLAPLALVILFCFLRDHWADFSFRQFRVQKEFIKKFLLLGCCYLPVFHAAFWTWLQYSHIATMTHMSTTAFFWDRFWAYLFDLNLGIIVYHPFTFTTFLFSIIIILWKRDWELMLLWFSLFAIVFGYSFMINIQSGMEGISRYGAWSVPVAIYVAICVIDQYVKVWVAYLLMAGSVAFNCMSLILPFYSGSKPSYIAGFMADYYPQWYNPFYPIFSYRFAHVNARLIYQSNHLPLVYNNGHCVKILVWKNQLAGFWDYMRDYDVNDIAFHEIEEQRTKLLKQKCLYCYINLSKKCWIGQKERFFSSKSLMFKDNARLEGESIILNKKSVQFGPYIFVMKGRYRVRVTGENLNKLHFFCSADNGKKKFLLQNVKSSGTEVEYEVVFNDSASRVEFVSRNTNFDWAKIHKITLSLVDKP